MDTTSPGFRARAARRRATWTITRFTELDAMKDAEYAYWATQPTHVVMTAVSEMSAAAHAMEGIHVRRISRHCGAGR